MFLMIYSGLLPNTQAQPKGGVEQYYYMNTRDVTINPRGWYQSAKGWYAEGRYNYEADKTFSMIAGKTFEYKAGVTCTVTPMAGFVAGQVNGAALAANTCIEHKKIALSVQSQYTLSWQNKNANFLYNWADLSYEVSRLLSAGVSVQQTNMYHCDRVRDMGIFFKAALGKLEIPVYYFMGEKNERYVVLGLSIAL